MMTNESAIDVIRKECYRFSLTGIDTAIQINTALDLAIEALKFKIEYDRNLAQKSE